jgi:drug/metabolite transporter (DMT)-like permease
VQPFTDGSGTLWWFFGEIVIGLSIYGQTAQAYALRTLGAGITSLLSSYGTLIVGLIGAIVILGETLKPPGYVAAAMLAVALGLGLVSAPAKANPSLSSAG